MTARKTRNLSLAVKGSVAVRLVGRQLFFSMVLPAKEIINHVLTFPDICQCVQDCALSNRLITEVWPYRFENGHADIDYKGISQLFL